MNFTAPPPEENLCEARAMAHVTAELIFGHSVYVIDSKHIGSGKRFRLFAYLCPVKGCSDTHLALEVPGVGPILMTIPTQDAEFLARQLINPQPLEKLEV